MVGDNPCSEDLSGSVLTERFEIFLRHVVPKRGSLIEPMDAILFILHTKEVI